MVKKTGLGRGLSNLIPGGDKPAEGITIASNPDYQEIPLDLIDPDPKQPRKRFKQEELNELEETIKNVGLIEPIVVRKKGDRYQLISGERRFRACRQAGFRKIPAVIKQVNDLQALEMGIIENIQREELTAIEEAKAYDYWIQESGLKPADIATRVGKDRSTVTNLIRLLKLPDEVLNLIEEKKLSAGQARPLLALGERKSIITLANKIVNEGWNARRVEDEVNALQSGLTSAKTPKSKPVDPNIRALEEKIRTRFTTKIAVSHGSGGSGKIVLNYANLNELDRILELMGVK